MKLAIYVHYSNDEKIHTYENILLKNLSKFFNKIIVVVNGSLSEEERVNLQSINNIDVLVRCNEGYDFHAWKYALDYVGWENIKSYEEILLTNNTFYGSIFPFEELFSKMCNVKCDFWGITKHPALNKNFIKKDKNTLFLEHIQSYWMLFKSSIITNNSFKDFWMNLPQMSDFATAVGYGELALTRYFESRGFKSATFIDSDKYHQLLQSNPCLFSDVMVMEDKCPIVKRKFFYDFINEYPQNGLCGNYRARKLLDYLFENNLFDCNIIIDDLLTLTKPSNLQQSLYIDYVISEDLEVIPHDCFHLRNEATNKENDIIENKSNFEADSSTRKLAIVFDLANDENNVGVIKSKIMDYDDNFDFIINCTNLFSNNEHSLKTEIAHISKTLKSKVYLATNENDLLELISSFHYQYIGYFSTKLIKSNDQYVSLVKRDWYLDNFLKNKTYITNIVNILSRSSRIGLLLVKGISSSNCIENTNLCFWTNSEIFQNIINNKEISLDDILVKHHLLLGSFISQKSLISQSNFTNYKITNASQSIEQYYSKLKKYLAKIRMYKCLSFIFFWKKKFFAKKVANTFDKIRKLVGIYQTK